jgi:predicted PurR-regulated permease PerM
VSDGSGSQASEPQRITRPVFYAAVALIAYLAYRIVEPFLAQIGWAVVLAIALAPARTRLARRLGDVRAALVLTVLVLLLLVVPVTLAVAMLVREGPGVVDYVQGQLRDRGGPMGLFHLAWEWLYARVPMLPTEEEVIERLTSSVGTVANAVVSNAGAVVKGALSFLVGLAITLGMLFFMLKDARDMTLALRRVLPFGREQNERLLTLTRDIVSASITSMLVNGVLQALLGGLAFFLLGIPGAPLWGGLMGVLSVLPAVGAALVWAPAAIWLALSGSLVKGVILALVGVLVLGNVDNVVRPMVLSGSARMSTLVLIVSLLGGVSAFGFIGIVLGPVVAAVLTALVESYHLTPDDEPDEAGEPPLPAGAPPASEAAAPAPAAQATGTASAGSLAVPQTPAAADASRAPGGGPPGAGGGSAAG